MARKKKEAEAYYSEPRRPIRLYVLAEEHRAIRLAAAAAGVPMSEFCRRAAVEKATAQQNRTGR